MVDDWQFAPSTPNPPPAEGRAGQYPGRGEKVDAAIGPEMRVQLSLGCYYGELQPAGRPAYRDCPYVGQRILPFAKV